MRLLKDGLALLAFSLGLLVSVVDFMVYMIHLLLQWFRMSLYIESAKLFDMDDDHIASLLQLKRGTD